MQHLTNCFPLTIVFPCGKFGFRNTGDCSHSCCLGNVVGKLIPVKPIVESNFHNSKENKSPPAITMLIFINAPIQNKQNFPLDLDYSLLK